MSASDAAVDAILRRFDHTVGSRVEINVDDRIASRERGNGDDCKMDEGDCRFVNTVFLDVSQEGKNDRVLRDFVLLQFCHIIRVFDRTDHVGM